MLPFYLFFNILGQGIVKRESESIVGGFRKLLQAVVREILEGYIWFKFANRLAKASEYNIFLKANYSYGSPQAFSYVGESVPRG